jgi:hypothetical protein
MTRFQLVQQSATSEITSRQRVTRVDGQFVALEAFECEIPCEPLGEIDVAEDITQHAPLGSEGINRIPRNRRAQMGLQAITVNDANRSVKQPDNVILQFNEIENGDASLGIDIDHDVEIAVGSVCAARHRAKHGGMGNATRA